MPHRPLEDWEYPDPEEDEDGDTVACPSCGQDVYEDSEACPYCGEYIDTRLATHALAGKQWWYIALVILGIVSFIVVSLQ